MRFASRLFGPNATLSLDALSNFFDRPVQFARRMQAIARVDPPIDGAQAIIDSLKANILSFQGDQIAYPPSVRGRFQLSEILSLMSGERAATRVIHKFC